MFIFFLRRGEERGAGEERGRNGRSRCKCIARSLHNGENERGNRDGIEEGNYNVTQVGTLVHPPRNCETTEVKSTKTRGGSMNHRDPRTRLTPLTSRTKEICGVTIVTQCHSHSEERVTCCESRHNCKSRRRSRLPPQSTWTAP